MMSSLLVSLSHFLSHFASLSSFGRNIDRQPPVPHYGLFLERRGEEDGKDDGEGEGEREGERRTGLFISARSS